MNCLWMFTTHLQVFILQASFIFIYMYKTLRVEILWLFCPNEVIILIVIITYTIWQFLLKDGCTQY
jgi:hypothetical protein